jgi:Caspase domain
MKRALIVGIDSYSNVSLSGCVTDAIEIAIALGKNGDGSPNFSNTLITSGTSEVSDSVLRNALSELFTGDAETALFFFSGQGLVHPDTKSAYIVSQDGTKGARGLSLSEILDTASAQYPRIQSTVVILDTWLSGFAGEIYGLGNAADISVIGNGLTIMTACRPEKRTGEINGHGFFTEMLLDGLSGSSADICGRITPASAYSLIDQTLGPREQRPVYKANVQTFVTLRRVAPKVPLDVLRRLPEYFKQPGDQFALNPSFEPDRENGPEAFRSVPVSSDHVKIFKELQLCNRHGLVVPVDAEHMYYAAINSTACKLTPLGVHYRRLAEMKRI